METPSTYQKLRNPQTSQYLQNPQTLHLLKGFAKKQQDLNIASLISDCERGHQLQRYSLRSHQQSIICNICDKSEIQNHNAYFGCERSDERGA